MTATRCLVFFSFIALLPTGDALSCYVCTPNYVGGETSKELAQKIETNITRTHTGELGPCSTFDPLAETYQKTCSFPKENSVCAKMTYGAWVALSCYWIPADADMVCETRKDGTHLCMCDGEFCNTKPNSAGATPLSLTLLVTTLLTAATFH